MDELDQDLVGKWMVSSERAREKLSEGGLKGSYVRIYGHW